MATIRDECAADVIAREMLLDAALGPLRRFKTFERLREGRLPSAGLSLVATTSGRLVGTVRLWSITAGPARPALLLGPLAVDREHRGIGAGAALVRTALTRACGLGHRAILLVGDAGYYGRFGFDSTRTGGLWLPGPHDSERLLALELEPGALDGAHGLVGATGPAAPRPALSELVTRHAEARNAA